jgi:hypothetical protein
MFFTKMKVFLFIMAKLSLANICRTSPFISVFGSNDANVISDLDGLLLDYQDGHLAVAGNAKIGGAQGAFVYVLDYATNC